MKKRIQHALMIFTLMFMSSTLFSQNASKHNSPSSFVLYPSGEAVSRERINQLIRNMHKHTNTSYKITNTDPIAKNDTVYICENSGLTTIHVQANDSDPNGDSLTTTIYSDNIDGSVATDGININYTPAAGHLGTDTVVYYVCDADNLSLCDTAIVFIHIVKNFTTNNAVSICQGDSAFLAGIYQHLPATYTSTLTAVGGCDSFVITKLTVNPKPLATITPNGPTVFCQGDSVMLTANANTSYLWSTGAITQSITVHTSGNYYVTVTNANGCPAKSLTTTVTVISGPTLTITPSSASICTNTSVSLTASGALSYSWSPAAGLSATSGSMVTANPANTATYTVMGSSGACIGTQIIVITVTPAPIISIVPSTTTICSSGSASLTASGATSYTWSPATGLSATSGSMVTANPANTTTYTVIGLNASCSGTQTTVVTVKPVSTPTITSNGSTTFCQGGSVILTSSTATSYSWSTGASTQSITVTASGNYSVTISDGTGCSATSANSSVTVNPLPVITIAPPSTSICTNTSVSLTASGALTYSWAPAAGLSATTGSMVTANPVNTSTYTVSGSNGICTGMQTVVITVTPAPNISIVPSSTNICPGGSTNLTATGGTSYTWSPATGLSVTSGSMVIANPANTTTYTVIGSNGTCSGTQTAVVTVMPVATPTITPGSSTTFCEGGSVIITSSTATSYSWSTGAITQSITADTSGNYFVTVKNAISCSATSASTSVTVNPLPIVTITPNGATTFCQGGSVMLTASNNSSYVWSTNAITQSITVATSGNYSVTVKNAFGCSATSSVTTVVVNQPPTGIITANGSTVFCQGDSVILTAALAVTYTWSTNATTQSITVFSSGSYSVSETNACGTTNSAITTVTVNPLPTAVITPGGATTFCQGDSVILSSNANVSYLWSTGAITKNIPVKTSGNYFVTVKNAFGCSATSATTTVTVNPFPTAAFSATITGLMTYSFTNTSTNATSYLWNFGNGQTSTATNPTCVYPTAGTYTVNLLASNACGSNNATDVITVVSESAFYNGFSPNGDGHNDSWDIPMLNDYTSNSVKIVNRWGSEVWQGINYNNKSIVWTGKNMVGDDLPDGTYYYIITYNNTDKRGWVIVKR
jgi:gliding motility-associated-like protein